jgi:hypothetical protein
METIRTEFTTEVADYLAAHHSLTLSTSSFTGLPHANTAPYVHEDNVVYFFVRDGSVLLRNLEQSHRVSFTIDDYSPTWGKQRELHGDGPAQAATIGQQTLALELALGKFDGNVPSGHIWTLEPAGMYFVDYAAR